MIDEYLMEVLSIDMFPILQEVITNTVIIFASCAFAYVTIDILKVMVKVASFKFFTKYESKLWVKK